MSLHSPHLASNYELAKANRKLVTVVMGMALLMALVACLAYLAGRSVTAMRAGQVPPPVVIEPQNFAPVPLPQPAAPAREVEPEPVPASVRRAVLPPPAKGEVRYLQVGLISPSREPQFTGKLKELGYPVHVRKEQNAVRILVGPVAGPAEYEALTRRLSQDGYQHFLKRFSTAE